MKNTGIKRIRDWWFKYEAKIIVFLGLILISILSFEAGILKGEKWQKMPLVIEKNAPCEKIPVIAEKPMEKPNLSSESVSSAFAKDCAFVGSKNSNKYHLPTCRWAKQIKPENIACFKSVEDAVVRSYQPDKNCIK